MNHRKPETLALVLRTYQQHATVAQTAATLGLSQKTVRRHLRAQGVEPVTQTWRVYPPNHPVQSKDILHALFEEQQMKVADIAIQLECDEQAVRRSLRLFGFQLRGRSIEQIGRKNHAWKGGTYTTSLGYVMQRATGHPHAYADGYYPQHRLVLEQKIGRYLLPEEVAHHIDENPANNDPSNLELFSSKTDHLQHHWNSGLRSLRKRMSLLSSRIAKDCEQKPNLDP